MSGTSTQGPDYPGEDSSWKRVRPCYWWRKARAHSLCRPSTSVTSTHTKSRDIYLQKMRGKCFNCLSTGHHVASCRDPTKCFICLHNGHWARNCDKKPATPPRPRPPAQDHPPVGLKPSC